MFKYLKRPTPLRIFGSLYLATTISASVGYLLKLIHPSAAIALDLALFMITKYFTPYTILTVPFSITISSVFSANPALLTLILLRVFRGKNPILCAEAAVTFIYVLNVIVIGPKLGGPIIAETLLKYTVIDWLYFYMDHLSWGLAYGLFLKYLVGIKEDAQET